MAWMLSACSQPRVDGTIFYESKKVFAEKIPVSEMFSPDFVTKSGDYFIISSSRSDTTLFLYETPSLTFKNATGIKGNGPDEIQMFPMFCHTLDNDYLYTGYDALNTNEEYVIFRDYTYYDGTDIKPLTSELLNKVEYSSNILISNYYKDSLKN